ncbi:MAG TPA: hypothetical protein VFX30_04495 [bacterium]|nr:hypothetical protein [bacterium]
MGIRRWIPAVFLLGLALPACLSNSGVTGGPEGFSDTVARTDDAAVQDQIKPHQGTVAAPDPDVTEEAKNTVRGTMEVLCRFENPAGYRARLKGQVFLRKETPFETSESPCESCQGKRLRVVFEAGGEGRFEEDTIGEGGVFDLIITAPDLAAIQLFVVTLSLPSSPSIPFPSLPSESSEDQPAKDELPGKPCNKDFCLPKDSFIVRNFLEQTGSIETAPACLQKMQFTKPQLPLGL